MVKKKHCEKINAEEPKYGKVGSMVDQMPSTNIEPFPTKTANRKKILANKMKTVQMIFDEEDE